MKPEILTKDSPRHQGYSQCGTREVNSRGQEILRRRLTTSLVSPVILASYTGIITFVPVSFFWLSSEKWPWDNSLIQNWDMQVTSREGYAHFIFFTAISNITPFPRLAPRRYFCALVDSKIRHSPNPSTLSKYNVALIGWIMDSTP